MEAADSLRSISTPPSTVCFGNHKPPPSRLESETNLEFKSQIRSIPSARSSEELICNQQITVPVEWDVWNDGGEAQTDETACTDAAPGSAECGHEKYYDVNCNFSDAHSRSDNEHVTKNEESGACDAPTAEALTRAGKRTDLTYCFGSAGWLFMYYFGVIKCLKELGLNK